MAVWMWTTNYWSKAIEKKKNMLGPFDVFPRLNTDRLVLRKLLPEDLPALIKMSTIL